MLGLLLHAVAAISLLGPQDTTLVAQVEAGVRSARSRLAPLAREVRERASLAQTNAEAWRVAARYQRAMALPLSPPDAKSWTADEALWRPGYVEALRGTLKADSAAVDALTALEQLAPYPRLWLTARAEVAHFRAINARQIALPPELAATWVELELEAGDSLGVSRAFAALPATLSAAARAYLGAEIAFARGDSALGVLRYHAGAMQIKSPLDVRFYGAQVEWIATDDELLEWRSLDITRAGPWLVRFWNARDAEDARPAGARLQEQFRRWRVALRDYRWSNDGWAAANPPFVEVPVGKSLPPGMQGSVLSGLQFLASLSPISPVLDDRGIIVMRHGDPLPAHKQPGGRSDRPVTLAWATSNGLLLLGFSKPGSSGDPESDGAVRVGMLVRGFPQGDLMTNCHLDSRLCVLAGLETLRQHSEWGNGAVKGEQIRQDYRTMRLQAESTDGNPQIFSHRLDLITQAYGVVGGKLLIVLAVPAQELLKDSRTGDTATTFVVKVRIAAYQSGSTEPGMLIDTLRRFHLARPAARGAYLSMLFELPASIGTWDVAVVASDTAAVSGGGGRVRGVPVVAFTGSALAMSDPILGRESSGMTWLHDGASIALNPTGAWRRKEAASLHYELDGLVPGREYETRLEVWDTKETSTTPRLKLGMRDIARSARESRDREISITQLPVGSYRLLVDVQDGTGAHVVRERRLVVQ